MTRDEPLAAAVTSVLDGTDMERVLRVQQALSAAIRAEGGVNTCDALFLAAAVVANATCASDASARPGLLRVIVRLALMLQEERTLHDDDGQADGAYHVH